MFRSLFSLSISAFLPLTSLYSYSVLSFLYSCVGFCILYLLPMWVGGGDRKARRRFDLVLLYLPFHILYFFLCLIFDIFHIVYFVHIWYFVFRICQGEGGDRKACGGWTSCCFICRFHIQPTIFQKHELKIRIAPLSPAFWGAGWIQIWWNASQVLPKVPLSLNLILS